MILYKVKRTVKVSQPNTEYAKATPLYLCLVGNHSVPSIGMLVYPFFGGLRVNPGVTA